MADAKIIRVPASGVSGTSEIDDNLDPSVLFESADGKDYLEIDTTDSAEKLILAGGGASVISAGDVEVEKDSPVLTLDNSTAEDGSGGRESTIQFKGVATRGSGTATTLGSMRYQHLGTGTGNRAEFVIAVNNSNDSGTTDTLNDRLRILGDSGTMRLGGVFQTGDGNAGAPSHAFTDSSNTGIFHDGANGLGLSSNGTMGLLLDSGNKIFTNGNSTTAGVASGGIQIQTGANSLANVNGSFNDLIIEGDGPIGMTFLANANSGIRFQKDANNDYHGITFDSGTTSIRTKCGNADRLLVHDNGLTRFNQTGVQYWAGTGNDDDDTEPVYLANSGAKLIFNSRNGNYGDVTLTANVTAIEFWYRPDDGRVYTVTAKIKQHASSAKTIDYSDSAVTVYSDNGSTSVTGEMKWSGGIHHTMSTGTSDVDIVQFTIFPNGSTFDVFASVIGQDFS